MDTTALNDTSKLISISPELAIAAIGVVSGLIRLAEWAFKLLYAKIKPGKEQTKSDVQSSVTLQLDPAISKAIYNTFESVHDVHSVIGRVDADGTPLVYSSRSGLTHLREIVSTINEVSKSQERLAATLERLDNRFIEHDKQENVGHTKIYDMMIMMNDSLSKRKIDGDA